MSVNYQETWGRFVGNRSVWLRPDTTDLQVAADTFTAQYHIPPPEMPAPQTVLDLGANIGLTAIHYATLWPEAVIVAVEMDADNVVLARKNFGGIVDERAVVGYPQPFNIVTYDGSRQDGYTVGQGQRIVPCVKLKTLIEYHFGGQVDFIKMDIEGSEWDIFANPDWLTLLSYLLVEVHGEGESLAVLQRGLTCLRRLGFVARHHFPHPQAIWAWRP